MNTAKLELMTVGELMNMCVEVRKRAESTESWVVVEPDDTVDMGMGVTTPNTPDACCSASFRTQNGITKQKSP